MPGSSHTPDIQAGVFSLAKKEAAEHACRGSRLVHLTESDGKRNGSSIVKVDPSPS